VEADGALITPWTGFYRPMGGLFYMTCLPRSLNPAPYHAHFDGAGGCVWLTYRFAKLLGAANSPAGWRAGDGVSPGPQQSVLQPALF